MGEKVLDLTQPYSHPCWRFGLWAGNPNQLIDAVEVTLINGNARPGLPSRRRRCRGRLVGREASNGYIKVSSTT